MVCRGQELTRLNGRLVHKDGLREEFLMRCFWTILACMLFLTALSACQAAAPTAGGTGNTDTSTATPGIMVQSTVAQTANPPSLLPTEENHMSPSLTPDNQTAQKMVMLVKEHLAQVLDISVDEIALTSAKSVVWRDASLGCPRPNVDFMQVDTPGYNIFLEVQGKTYNYHTDAVKRFVICKRG